MAGCPAARGSPARALAAQLAVVRNVAAEAYDILSSEGAGDGGHRPRILAAMAECLHPIFETEGVLRKPKVNGCFVADA